MADPGRLPDHPHDAYAALREEATRLAGGPGDIAQRAALHHSLYLDSNGNHTFPQIALHGALWAAGFFETTGRLGDMLRARYFYNARERAYRMGLLNQFAAGFKTVNRLVFIDTYTNYFFTKRFGGDPAARGILHPELFAALAAMHDATRAGVALASDQKRHLFLQALQYEQEVTVAPGVRDEIAKFSCPVLTFLCLKPVVRFAYFPRSTYFVFRNFADKPERIDKALRSYALAERAGWPAAVATMRAYGVLPEAFFANPPSYMDSLKASAHGSPVMTNS